MHPNVIREAISSYMKTTLLCALAAPAFLSSCIVLPSERRVVAVQEPAPVVYESYRPGYVVTTLPVGYRTVRYNRDVYYENRGVYYRPASRGYVVVRRPY
jgi:hypothetical protein